MKKICFTEALVICLVSLLSFSAFANEVNNSNEISFETTASLQDLSDGVTVTVVKGHDGTWHKINDSDSVMLPNSIGPDGKIDMATFHLGLNHFDGSTAELYYRVTCDEPIYYVNGTANVTSDNRLIGKNYFNASFASLVGATSATKNFGKTKNIDPKETKVKVSFTNVSMTIYSGDTASFPNNSKTVKLSSIRG